MVAIMGADDERDAYDVSGTRETLRRCRESVIRIREAADSLNDAFAKVEAALLAKNMEFASFVQLPEGHGTLGWTRTSDGWRLIVRIGSTEQPLTSQSIDIRLSAVDVIHRLVEDIACAWSLRTWLSVP